MAQPPERGTGITPSVRRAAVRSRPDSIGAARCRKPPCTPGPESGNHAAETLVVAAVAHQPCVRLAYRCCWVPRWYPPTRGVLRAQPLRSTASRLPLAAVADGTSPKQPASARGRLGSASSSAVAAALSPWISARSCRPGMRSRRSPVARAALCEYLYSTSISTYNIPVTGKPGLRDGSGCTKGLACSAHELLTSWERTWRPQSGD
jgi:hypothetical protein